MQIQKPINKTAASHSKRMLKGMGSTIMALPTLTVPHDTSKNTQKTEFKIRLANRHGILREASMLIQERYAQRGYGIQELAEDPNRLSIVAYEDSEPIGTLSIGFDSCAGLLCDDLYKVEIDKLRTVGRKVCEFIKFAVITSSSSTKTLASLFHTAYTYAHRIRNFDDVVIEVNPRHVKFYQHALGFKKVGSERINRRVNAPAILLHAEFTHISEQIRKCRTGEASPKEMRSIYPYCFCEQEEQGILQRLRALYEAK